MASGGCYLWIHALIDFCLALQTLQQINRSLEASA